MDKDSTVQDPVLRLSFLDCVKAERNLESLTLPVLGVKKLFGDARLVKSPPLTPTTAAKNTNF